jgi:hypothetical protein
VTPREALAHFSQKARRESGSSWFWSFMAELRRIGIGGAEVRKKVEQVFNLFRGAMRCSRQTRRTG